MPFLCLPTFALQKKIGQRIGWSKNGIDWEEDKKLPRDLANHFFSDCVIYGGRKFIVLADLLFIYFIKEEWKVKDMLKEIRLDYTISSFRGIAYGKNRFVAVGDKGVVAYSNDFKDIPFDDITWEVKYGTFGQDKINAITYGGNSFVAVGEKGKIAYSSDGIVWTEVEKSPFKKGNDDIRFILAVPLKN
jgi:hypothetical protein